MEALLPILKDFGFPIALCIVLLLAIRHQNAALVKAYTDRILVLEKIVKANTDEIHELQAERIKRADEYGHTLKDMAIRYSNTIRDHDALMKSALNVLRQLTDAVAARPCMADPPYHPSAHKVVRTPSSSEIPADPSKSPTDRYGNGG